MHALNLAVRYRKILNTPVIVRSFDTQAHEHMALIVKSYAPSHGNIGRLGIESFFRFPDRFFVNPHAVLYTTTYKLGHGKGYVMKLKIVLLVGFILIATSVPSVLRAQEARREFTIAEKYLNMPVQESADRQTMTFEINGEQERSFVIRLSEGEPDYWVFADLSGYFGKTLTVTYPTNTGGFGKMYQADRFAGEDSVYQEINRPQFHFTSRRGWNNDPNGLVYYDGEYHLFYQHNPYEANWENMHWGHAISTDLLRWQELPDALYPDELGTMFSGTAAIDWNNDSGFQTGQDPPIIAAYTAHKSLGNGDAIETQNIAYSNDRGRTFTKYDGNPVIDSKAKWNSRHTRDPKIFWHEPTRKWVMVLFEKDGHSFYNSDDLKEWTYLSHLVGFWECPELFELPVDGNTYNTKWVIYGASGTYMIGDFDGREFNVESGKHRFVAGGHYAAQTYNDIPADDGRRIQFAWGQITHDGMPFKSMMLFPTELTLRSTRNGIRLFSEPVEEISQLHEKEQPLGESLPGAGQSTPQYGRRRPLPR